MNIKKCDRCGEILNYTEEKAAFIKAFESIGASISTYCRIMSGVTTYHVYANEKLADLCPACEKSFKEWMAYGQKIKKIKETVTPDEIIRDGKRYKLEKETDPEEDQKTEDDADEIKFGDF